MKAVEKDQQLRASVANILSDFGILERERASMDSNQLVGIVTALLPEKQIESDVIDMLAKAVNWYFGGNPFPKAILTATARALWFRLLYGWLYDEVLRILGEANIPEIGSFLSTKFHEETKGILYQMIKTQNLYDIRKVVFDEFQKKWFLDQISHTQDIQISLVTQDIARAWDKWAKEKRKSVSLRKSRAGHILRAK